MIDAGTSAAVVREWIQSGREVRLPVIGTSMLPSIHPGDEVVVERLGRALGTGDLVVRLAGDGLLIHRVIARLEQDQGSALVTKGDNSRTIDPLCTEDDILGEAISIYRKGRECRLGGHFLRWTGQGLGWLSGLRLERVFEGRVQRIREGDIVGNQVDLQQNDNPGLKLLFFGVRWIHGMLFWFKLRLLK